MPHRTPRRARRLVAASAALGLLGLPLLTSTAADAAGTDVVSKPRPPAVKVMTRNVYLGADIMRPIAAVQQAQQGGANTMEVIDAFANANDATWDVMVDTDYPSRAKLLAGELVDHRPDLVGLQEVALWRTGAFENPAGPNGLKPNATEPAYDFLKILLTELKEQGTPYRALSVNTLSDVEGPAYEGSLGNPSAARDVRLTMRDVILVRKGSTAQYVNGSAGKRTYEDMLSFAVGGQTFEFKRGFQWVDMKAGDRKFRFINTHLEAFSSDIAYDQVQQVLGSAGAFSGRTILVCDCNSDPLNGTVKRSIGDEKRHWDPYYSVLRSGFNDTWLQWAPPQQGWTSGLGERVDDAAASGFDHRIDMVFARTAKGDKLPVLSGDVTGDELTDRNAEGLWPSDHAGVVMKLRLR